MKNDVKNAEQVDLQDFPQPTLADVKKWLDDDLGRARALLQAVHDNPNIKHLVAEHMLGELQNYYNRKKAAEAVN